MSASSSRESYFGHAMHLSPHLHHHHRNNDRCTHHRDEGYQERRQHHHQHTPQRALKVSGLHAAADVA